MIVPDSANVTVPPLVVAINAFTARFVPVSDTPVAPLVRTASVPAGADVNAPPLSVVVPLPATCVRLAARIPLAVTSAAELIVIAPTGVVSPTRPLNVTFPVPAVSDSV